jgi:hypothetical protein
MKRIAHLALLVLCTAACRENDISTKADAQPAADQLSHAPEDAEHLIAVPISERIPGSVVRMGPYSLIRDSTTLGRIWTNRQQPPPRIDFDSSVLLALRVYAAIDDTAAAPRLLVRRGVTFVVLRAGTGPVHSTGNDDEIRFFRIPTGGGSVRYITYESRTRSVP